MSGDQDRYGEDGYGDFEDGYADFKDGYDDGHDSPYDPPRSRSRRGYRDRERHPDGASTILVMGILGLVVCAPLGIFAWVQGNTYMAQCERMGVRPEDTAVAGRICGMIAGILMLIGVAIFAFVFCAGAGGAAL